MNDGPLKRIIMLNKQAKSNIVDLNKKLDQFDQID